VLLVSKEISWVIETLFKNYLIEILKNQSLDLKVVKIVGCYKKFNNYNKNYYKINKN